MTTELTNGIDEPTLMHFIREENSLSAQISALKAKRKNFRSGIKSTGVKLKNFDAVLTMFNAQDGGEEATDDLREKRNLARMAKIPFGYQFSFFDEKNVVKDSPSGGAEEQGRRAYLSLVKESENPFPANTPQGQDWLNGYRAAESLCKVGKEKLTSAPAVQTEEKPKTGKMAAAGDDSDQPDPAPKQSRKRAPNPEAPRTTKPARKSRGK